MYSALTIFLTCHLSGVGVAYSVNASNQFVSGMSHVFSPSIVSTTDLVRLTERQRHERWVLAAHAPLALNRYVENTLSIISGSTFH